MEYKTVIGLTQAVIDAVQNSAISINRSLKNTLSVKIANPVKKVEVKGQVVVSNLKNLDKPLKQLREATLAVKTSVESIPTEIKVNNFPTSIKVDNPPVDRTDDIVKALDSVGEKVSTLHKPTSDKKFFVTNQPTKELSAIEKAVFKVSDSLSKIKFNPQINVEAPKPERVVVPPAQVTVERVEIDYKKLAKEVSLVTKEIDYKKLADTLATKMASLVISGGGGGGGTTSFKNSLGQPTRALVDDEGRLVTATTTEEKYYLLEQTESGGVQYVGSATPAGAWMIKKYENESMRYTTGDSDFVTNWTNRASLDYDYIFNL